MKKISTGMAKKAEKVESQKLTIRAGVGEKVAVRGDAEQALESAGDYLNMIRADIAARKP